MDSEVAKRPWLVIDARAAQEGMMSSISRFVVGLTTALVAELSVRKVTFNNHRLVPKILIISKSHPPLWVIDLVQKYPDIIAFWSGGPGALTHTCEKPIWLWSTRVFKTILKLTNGNAIWLAPANLDRPLFISNSSMSSRVIQVVHDTAPLMKLKGIRFLFKKYFKFFVKRNLHKLPNVVTISSHAATKLKTIYKKRKDSLTVIPNAVNFVFGNKPKIYDKKILAAQRKHVFEMMKESDDHSLILEMDHNLFYSYWILGVGPNERYKCWDLAAKAIQNISEKHVVQQDKSKESENDSFWFVRVGADAKEIRSYAKKFPVRKIGRIQFIEKLKILFFPELPEAQLAELYRAADLLVHPSLSEGFGLAPLEAALSGVPVLSRVGTAVSSHFAEGALPSEYWHEVNSNVPAVWASQIEDMLKNKKSSRFYKGLFLAQTTRPYVIDYSKSKNFEWRESAACLLDLVSHQVK